MNIATAMRNPGLRKVVNNSGLTTLDGLSIVWLLKWHGFRNVSRVCGSDLRLEISRLSKARPWRHFFHGGAPGMAEALANHLLSRSPNLQIAGTYSPPFQPLTAAENQAITERIHASRADIV